MKENEIWKDIVGYENIYQISNLGGIKRLSWVCQKSDGTTQKLKGIIRKPGMANGYYRIGLWKNNLERVKYIHVLIAEAFIPNPFNKPQINHKNGVKTDNRIDNLEWVTPGENLSHAYKIGLNKSASLGRLGIYSFRGLRVQCLFTGEIMTQKQAATFLGISRSLMCNIISGKIKNNWTGFVKI